MLMPDADTGSNQSFSAQPSSSPRASSSAAHHPPPPSYLSARSADVILSEVRPTRIKSEALRSVNVLLDELLWLILGCARSFATERLRTGLLKVLPTVLGKDALLEAEVELRAYIERNPPATPSPTDEPTIQQFPLQPAFELLRIKCEAYSSLGDLEENPEAESSLHARMAQLAGDATPKLSAVAPAALYLTAILEHVCEHVLSNVGRVVARDSSRTTAHTQDLYVALCEDESIYSVFKTMKVQEQIEQQSKLARPRRSKSMSRNDIGTETPVDTPAVPKSRQSLDSAISNGSNSNVPTRASAEKARSKALFKNSSNRAPSDSNHSNVSDTHRRSNSLLDDKNNISTLPEDAAKSNMDTSPTDDDGSMQDFDDLMRSGTTMKVSLTPDRLKTFEVFAKEKNQRANRPSQLPPSPSGRDTTSPPSSFHNGAPHLLHKANLPSRSRNHVESIAEAPEGDLGRSRAASITTPTSPKLENPSITSRSRSFTDTRGHPAMPELHSLSLNGRPDSSNVIPPSKRAISVAAVDPGLPKRTRRQPPRNRESIDLDDVMDESEDEIPVAKKVSLMPKSAQATVSGTRDLMDFLSEGPPDLPPTVTTPSTSVVVSDAHRSKQGRFRTMVSRLTGSSSNERLSPRSGDDPLDNVRSATAGVNGSTTPTRPQPGSLHYKRSAPNVAAVPRSMSSPLTPPESSVPSLGLRARQLSLSRKAVPAWDGTQKEKADPLTKSLTRQADSDDNMTSLPRPLISSATQPSPNSNTEAVSPTRKRAPRDGFDQLSNGPRVVDGDEKVLPQPEAHSTNEHAKTNQELVEPLPHGLSKIEPREAQTDMMLSIAADGLVRDFRRLMSRATSADECRVLVDMFLTKCGTLRDEEQPSRPITSPTLPISVEANNHDELRLIEVLLGDGGASSSHTPPHSPECIPQPGASRTVLPATPGVASTT